jgi:hypothetical protein
LSPGMPISTSFYLYLLPGHPQGPRGPAREGTVTHWHVAGMCSLPNNRRSACIACSHPSGVCRGPVNYCCRGRGEPGSA